MNQRPSQSIIHRLRYRELVDDKPRSCHHHIQRSLYQNIHPTISVIDIQMPRCFVRKFSPDGKYLLAFSVNQNSLHIFEYQGPAAANDLLQNLLVEGDLIGSDPHNPVWVEIRAKIFERFFFHKHIINLTNNYEKINREFSLFTADGRYVIVASSTTIAGHPTYYDVLRNNESISVNVRFFLKNYYVYLIDIVNGAVCDRLDFRTDHITLSHNQGIYLYKDWVAILSIQHQIIHIYRIVDSSDRGKIFRLLNNIGRFSFDADATDIALSDSFTGRFNHTSQPYHEVFLSAIKHRFLSFLYRRALRESQANRSSHPLVIYNRQFSHYCSLKMSKMQFLDSDHLLVKYEIVEAITQRPPESSRYPSYFFIYQISDSKILEVYENSSEELLKLFENYYDCFRDVNTSYNQYICTAENNAHVRAVSRKFKKLLVRDGCSVDAARKVLSLLPMSAQSYSLCPYLDLSLFGYDDRWISPMERPKACGEHPIRFFSRCSGSFCFQMHADQPQNSDGTPLRLIAFAFHPSDPFIISIQRTGAEFTVNLHFRYTFTRL